MRPALLVVLASVFGCTPDPDLGFVPVSNLQRSDLERGEPEVYCDATEYPAVVATYPVTNTVPAGTAHWQFHVGEVEVQPLTGMFDVRFRETDDYIVRLAPGESATVEVWALRAPAPGSIVEFVVSYRFVPAGDADAGTTTSASWTTELGTETVTLIPCD